MGRFIDVDTDGNLSALIISGFPSQLELTIAWNEIQQEFTDMMGDAEAKFYMNLFKSVNALKGQLTQFDFLYMQMQSVYCEQFGREINRIIKTSFQFDPFQPIEYQALLKRCYNRSRALKIDLDLKTANLTAIEQKHKNKGASPTREFYQGMFITLSDFAKYPLHDDITVWEYCNRVIRLNKHCEMLEEQRKKIGHGPRR